MHNLRLDGLTLSACVCVRARLHASVGSGLPCPPYKQRIRLTFFFLLSASPPKSYYRRCVCACSEQIRILASGRVHVNAVRCCCCCAQVCGPVLWSTKHIVSDYPWRWWCCCWSCRQSSFFLLGGRVDRHGRWSPRAIRPMRIMCKMHIYLRPVGVCAVFKVRMVVVGWFCLVASMSMGL